MVDGYAVKVLLMSPVLIDYMGNFVRVALLAPVVVRDLRTAAVLWVPSGASRCCGRGQPHCLCAGTVRHARGAAVARGARARGLHVVCLLIGGHLLGEGTAWRLCGAVCIALGVTALAFGVNMQNPPPLLLGVDFSSSPSRRKPIV